VWGRAGSPAGEVPDFRYSDVIPTCHTHLLLLLGLGGGRCIVNSLFYYMTGAYWHTEGAGGGAGREGHRADSVPSAHIIPVVTVTDVGPGSEYTNRTGPRSHRILSTVGRGTIDEEYTHTHTDV
jgi:hypothetical protein